MRSFLVSILLLAAIINSKGQSQNIAIDGTKTSVWEKLAPFFSPPKALEVYGKEVI